MTRIQKSRQRWISQGDVIRDVQYIEAISERSDHIEVSKVVYPLVVVLTQDCDLRQDYRVRWSRQEQQTQDKSITSILVAPLYNAEHFKVGEHLDELGLTMRRINWKRTEGDHLRSNQLPRYHYIAFPPDVPIVPSVIDFKHYFSVPLEYLRDHHRHHFVCRLSPLFREDLSQRFASFLARIGLPEQ